MVFKIFKRECVCLTANRKGRKVALDAGTSLFRIRLFHPHGAHPQKTQLVRDQFDGSRREKRTEGGQREGREEAGSIVSFNDNRRGRRTFDRINRLVSMVLLNIAGTRVKR